MHPMRAIVPVLLAAVLASFPAAPRAQALPTTPVDSIVAVVDEDVILRSELDLAVANISRQIAAGNQGQLPPRDVLERQVLERLVLMRLQVNRAGDSGIRISDQELQQAIAGIAQQNNMSVQDLRARLEADHLSYQEFQANVRDEVTVQRLRQRYIQSSVQVSEAEIDQLLATTQVGGAELHLANLQINVDEGATPEQILAAKKKIDDIKAQVERGELDFRSAAIRYSQAQNALDGGDLGWRAPDAIPPVFATMLKAMKPGQITEAVRGPSGFQVVQLVEQREAQPQKITQYHAQDIMVAVNDVVPDEVARQKIEALRERIAKGEDFGKVAREASDDTQTRAAGGDMGWFAADAWGTAIGGQVRQLADGQVSPVFKSDVGYHLVKRLGAREQDVTDENRRNQAREVIGQRKAEEAYERFLRQLRAEAYVDARLGGA
jgi:peptidyl-prolyl cis-trans isomerase SurA